MEDDPRIFNNGQKKGGKNKENREVDTTNKFPELKKDPGVQMKKSFMD